MIENVTAPQGHQVIVNKQNNSKLSFRRNDFESSPKNDTFTKKDNTTQNIAIGTVAAIAIAAIADGIFAKGKHIKKLLGMSEKKAAKPDNVNPESVKPAEDEIKKIKDEISKLKEKILYDYKKGQYEIDELCVELNAFDKQLSGGKVTSSKDLDKILKIRSDETSKIYDDKSVEELRKIVSEFSTKVRSRLQELSQNKDWVEMRKLNRELRHKSRNNDEIARGMLLPDIILSMAKGEPNERLKILKLTIEDAIAIVKSPNTAEEYGKKVSSKFKYGDPGHEIASTVKSTHLTLKDLFEHFGADDAEISMKRIRGNKDAILRVQNAKEKYGEQLDNSSKELVERIRKSEDVSKLKELVAKLHELTAGKAD